MNSPWVSGFITVTLGMKQFHLLLSCYTCFFLLLLPVTIWTLIVLPFIIAPWNIENGFSSFSNLILLLVTFDFWLTQVFDSVTCNTRNGTGWFISSTISTVLSILSRLSDTQDKILWSGINTLEIVFTSDASKNIMFHGLIIPYIHLMESHQSYNVLGTMLQF